MTTEPVDPEDVAAERYVQGLLSDMFREPLTAIAQQREDLDRVALALEMLRKSLSNSSETQRAMTRRLERAIDDNTSDVARQHEALSGGLSAMDDTVVDATLALASLSDRVAEQEAATVLIGVAVEDLKAAQVGLVGAFEVVSKQFEAYREQTTKASEAHAVELRQHSESQARRLTLIGLLILVVAVLTLATSTIGWRI